MSVRKELEEILKKGKSPIHNGVTYTSVNELPSDAELSKGDAEKEEAARKNIKSELQRLSEELALLDDGAKESKSTEKKAESSASEKASATAAEVANPKSAVKTEKPVE